MRFDDLPAELDSSEAQAWRFPVAELNPRSEWEKIGEGSFGKVWKARLLGLTVAVKENASGKDNRLEGIQRDIAYLRHGVAATRARALWRAPRAATRELQHSRVRVQRSHRLTRAAARTRSAHPHPNIVQVLGAFETHEKLCVVMGARCRARAPCPCSGALTRALSRRRVHGTQPARAARGE